MLHHVAPVAGRVADREEDRLVLAARPLQRLVAPGVPVDGVVGVLEEVGARLAREAVHPSTSRTPRSLVRIRARARDESSEQSSGRSAGAVAVATEPPLTSSANCARETASAPATCSRPAASVSCELEQRRRQVVHLDRAANLVRVERVRAVPGRGLVFRGLRAAVEERRPHEQRVRMRRRDPALGVGLRAAVRRHWRGRILLDVRRALAAVEDDVGRQVHEPRADRRSGPGDVLGAVDRDLAGVGTVLAVGGVDDDVGPHALEERPHRAGVADLDALGRGVRPQANERGAEIPRRTGDVKAHACTLSGLQLRLAP